jgi:hypothetical protein
MNPKSTITNELIAPCGMNCGICRAYLREKKKCPGCRGSNDSKLPSTVRCIIKNCDYLKENNLKFCFKCETYPCARLKALDKRYRTKYRMSMLENLGNIEEKGIREFVRNEIKRWACSECGAVICVHGGYCTGCGIMMGSN